QTKSASNFLILKAGDAPTVIVECGFLSNPREEALLQESDYQDKIAWSIYRGIIDYISET
ncbi:MAG: N-acetylmuramoyl-L-alanine amidase, partial [Eubacteriales bacterium]